jgi:hypothetical protein
MSAATLTAPVPTQVGPLRYRTERAAPGAASTDLDPGDLVLVARTGGTARLIRFGQRLRLRGADRGYAKWTHAALLVDSAGTLVEAEGTGLQHGHLDRYVDDDYVVVRLEVSAANRADLVRIAVWTLRNSGRTTVGVLVGGALERIGVLFDRDAARLTPADLARYFRASSPTHTAAWTGSLRTARDRAPSPR